MKVIAGSLLFLFCMSSFAQGKQVRVKMVQYVDYCNEGNSTKALKNSPNKSVVYANKKLIVLNDDHIDTVITDKSGYLKATWAYGTYLLFEPWKYYKQIPKGYSNLNLDVACLQKEWLKEDLKIVVSKKTTTVANNIVLIKCPSEFSCLIDQKTQNQR